MKEESDTKTRSKRGKSARRKGHQFERDIANALKNVFPNAERQLESQHGFGYDIANTFPYRIQCKCYQDYAPINKINEVPEEDGAIPVLVTKGNRKEPMAVMHLIFFLRILRRGCRTMTYEALAHYIL